MPAHETPRRHPVASRWLGTTVAYWAIVGPTAALAAIAVHAAALLVPGAPDAGETLVRMATFVLAAWVGYLVGDLVLESAASTSGSPGAPGGSVTEPARSAEQAPSRPLARSGFACARTTRTWIAHNAVAASSGLVAAGLWDPVAGCVGLGAWCGAMLTLRTTVLATAAP